MSEFEYDSYGRCIRMDGMTARQLEMEEQQEDRQREQESMAWEMAQKWARDQYGCDLTELDEDVNQPLLDEAMEMVGGIR